MFWIFKIGFREYLIVPDDPAANALGGIVEMFFIIMTVGTLIYISDVAAIPILCVVVSVFFINVVLYSNTLRAASALTVPFLIYALEDFMYAMFCKPVYQGKDFIVGAIFAWLLIGLGLAAFSLAFVFEQISEFLGVLSLGICAFLWFYPFYVMVMENEGTLFRHIFGAAWLIAIIMFIVLLIKGLPTASEKTGHGKRGLLLDIIAIGVGYIPLMVARIANSMKGIMLFFIVILIYGGIGIVLTYIAKLFQQGEGKELSPSPGPALIPLLFSAFFHFYETADKSYMIPNAFLPEFVKSLKGSFFAAFSDEVGVIVSPLREVTSRLLYYIINLLPVNAPKFLIPGQIAYIMCMFLFILTMGLGLRFTDKRKATKMQKKP